MRVSDVQRRGRERSRPPAPRYHWPLELPLRRPRSPPDGPLPPVAPLAPLAPLPPALASHSAPLIDPPTPHYMPDEAVKLYRPDWVATTSMSSALQDQLFNPDTPINMDRPPQYASATSSTSLLPQDQVINPETPIYLDPHQCTPDASIYRPNCSNTPRGEFNQVRQLISPDTSVIFESQAQYPPNLESQFYRPTWVDTSTPPSSQVGNQEYQLISPALDPPSPHYTRNWVGTPKSQVSALEHPLISPDALIVLDDNNETRSDGINERRVSDCLPSDLLSSEPPSPTESRGYQIPYSNDLLQIYSGLPQPATEKYQCKSEQCHTQEQFNLQSRQDTKPALAQLAGSRQNLSEEYHRHENFNLNSYQDEKPTLAQLAESLNQNDSELPLKIYKRIIDPPEAIHIHITDHPTPYTLGNSDITFGSSEINLGTLEMNCQNCYESDIRNRLGLQKQLCAQYQHLEYHNIERFDSNDWPVPISLDSSLTSIFQDNQQQYNSVPKQSISNLNVRPNRFEPLGPLVVNNGHLPHLAGPYSYPMSFISNQQFQKQPSSQIYPRPVIEERQNQEEQSEMPFWNIDKMNQKKSPTSKINLNDHIQNVPKNSPAKHKRLRFEDTGEHNREYNKRLVRREYEKRNELLRKLGCNVDDTDEENEEEQRQCRTSDVENTENVATDDLSSTNQQEDAFLKRFEKIRLRNSFISTLSDEQNRTLEAKVDYQQSKHKSIGERLYGVFDHNVVHTSQKPDNRGDILLSKLTCVKDDNILNDPNNNDEEFPYTSEYTDAYDESGTYSPNQSDILMFEDTSKRADADTKIPSQKSKGLKDNKQKVLLGNIEGGYIGEYDSCESMLEKLHSTDMVETGKETRGDISNDVHELNVHVSRKSQNVSKTKNKSTKPMCQCTKTETKKATANKTEDTEIPDCQKERKTGKDQKGKSYGKSSKARKPAKKRYIN